MKETKKDIKPRYNQDIKPSIEEISFSTKYRNKNRRNRRK